MDSSVDVVIAPRCRWQGRWAAITAEASVGVPQRRLGVTGIGWLVINHPSLAQIIREQRSNISNKRTSKNSQMPCNITECDFEYNSDPAQKSRAEIKPELAVGQFDLRAGPGPWCFIALFFRLEKWGLSIAFTSFQYSMPLVLLNKVHYYFIFPFFEYKNYMKNNGWKCLRCNIFGKF